MTLKNNWAIGNKFQPTDANAVANQVNINTNDVATHTATLSTQADEIAAAATAALEMSIVFG